MKKNVIILIILFGFCNCIFSQPQVENLRIIISPDHQDWTYKIGEKVIFSVTILQYSNPLNNVEITWEVMPEMMEPVKSDTIILKSGKTEIDGGTMKNPGFLSCKVKVNMNGRNYEEWTSVAFEPEKIKPTTTLPDDFQDFWEKAKDELAKIPVEPVMTLIPERCTDKVNVYHVGIRNISGKIYGILTVPKQSGKYPALLTVPGAGVRPYRGDLRRAEKGIITLEIGIHGIPVNLDMGVYDDLRFAAVSGYQTANLDDRDQYYYKRVYLGCVRAVDFIFTLPEFNGENIAVTGGSQGGALSLITASLDPRIKYLGAFYPALCDLTGYLHGRAGGWPHMFNDQFTNKPEKVETSKYYDVVNFARFIKIPGLYSWGFNDNVCPPTSMFSAYNVIEAPKELMLYYDTRHWTYPEQREKMDEWLYEKLLK